MRTHPWREGPGLARMRDARWGARVRSIVDGGDQVHGDSTTRAAQRVHAEHTLEEFGPGEPPRSVAVRDGVEVIGAPRIAGGAKGARRTLCLSAWIHSEARIGGLGIAQPK